MAQLAAATDRTTESVSVTQLGNLTVNNRPSELTFPNKCLYILMLSFYSSTNIRAH